MDDVNLVSVQPVSECAVRKIKSYVWGQLLLRFSIKCFG